MLRKIVVMCVGLLVLQAVLPCEGAVIASWAFESGGDVTYPYDADAGSQAGSTITFSVGSPSIDSGGGYLGGDALQAASGGVFLDIHVVGTALSGFALSYNAKVSSGAVAQNWTYRYTGQPSFISTGIPAQPGNLGTAYGSYTVDFSPVTALDGKAEVWFRNTVFNTGQSANFDNFSVSAIPEPTHVALALFGLCSIGTVVGRRVYRWLRS